MKTIVFKHFFAKLFILILILLSSCTTSGQSTPETMPLTVPASTISPSLPEIQSSNSPAIRHTITSSPTLVTPSSTHISSEPTPSQTLLPTMNATQRVDYFSELLETNGACKLPCWWGITPGQSSWDEIQGQLRHIGWQDNATKLDTGLIKHSTHVSGGFNIDVIDIYNNQPGILFNLIYFVERTPIVERIHIRSLGYSNPPAFNSLWKSYMPREILRIYSEPDRIWIYSSPIIIGDRHSYDLWLIYDQLGFVVNYVGFLHVSDDSFRICISNSGEYINTLKMHLQAPEDPTPLELMGNLIDFEDRGILSIEAAAGLTKKEFYEMLIQSDSSVCFDTPISIWKEGE